MTRGRGPRRRARQSAVRPGALAAIVLLVVACGQPPATAEPEPTTSIDQTGILLIGPTGPVQAGPVTRRFADPLESALLLAESNGEDVGLPWFDPETEELVLSAVTPHGRELIDALQLAVPYRVRDVPHGAAELRTIQDEAASLASSGVEDAHLIYMISPDHRDNRVLISISQMSRPLLDYLAATYPPDALAVQIDPDLSGAAPA